MSSENRSTDNLPDTANISSTLQLAVISMKDLVLDLKIDMHTLQSVVKYPVYLSISAQSVR